MEIINSIFGYVKSMCAESVKKLLTAGMQKRQKIEQQEAGNGHPATMSVSADSRDVMATINTLREDLYLLAGGAAPEITFDETPAALHAAGKTYENDQRVAGKECDRRFSELNRLTTALGVFLADIERTKQKIASLHPSQTDDERLMTMASRLEGIVNAPDAILKAAEKIDTLVGNIKAGACDACQMQLVGKISGTGVSIFESCTLQEIADQRITQVLHTLQCVEERVREMITSWWGVGDFVHIDARREDCDADRKLFNRSQTGRRRIRQDEIDQLFS